MDWFLYDKGLRHERVNMYYESLWKYLVIQQGVFNRVTYYIASSMNNASSMSIWF